MKATLVALGVALLGATPILAANLDLSVAGSQSLTLPGTNQSGSTVNATVADFWTQPAGTGVFDPFLTLRDPGGNVGQERGFNTNHVLYNDQQRPEWNTLLRVGQLGTVTVNGVANYAFLLDANEPGGSASLINIDNIRVYISSTDNTAAVGNLSVSGQSGSQLNTALAPLGTLVFGMDTNNKVILDSAQENVTGSNANGGSGQSDLVLYIPVSAFTTAGANANSFVWFFNANGSLDNVAEDGFEEWKAVLGPQGQVPDGGTTAMLLGAALFGLFAVRRRLPV
jgi:hypothetical protein